MKSAAEQLEEVGMDAWRASEPSPPVVHVHRFPKQSEEPIFQLWMALVHTLAAVTNACAVVYHLRRVHWEKQNAGK